MPHKNIQTIFDWIKKKEQEAATNNTDEYK